MDAILTSPWFLAALFLGIAFLYSSVGLGGGSSYTALMAIWGMGAAVLPLLTLMLNLIVTTVGSINYLRNRHLKARLIVPFLVTSVPMAYLGGALDVSEAVFQWVLLVSLIFVAARIYLWRETAFRLNLGRTGRIVLSLVAGSILGLVAGIVGIGGGIYLVPLILILGLGTEKEAAACGSAFIWVNSIAGLASRLEHNYIDFTDYLPLLAAVLIGGFLGSLLGSAKLSPRTMQRILGVVVLVAILFLARQMIGA